MSTVQDPIDIRINCPICGVLHIDEGEFATKSHHTHSCQGCGMTWRPCVQNTRGVQFLPGFKNGSGIVPTCSGCAHRRHTAGFCSHRDCDCKSEDKS